MAKMCPETVIFAVGEKKLVDFNFEADLGAYDIGSTPAFVVGSGGPSASGFSFSGKLAQAYFDSTGVTPGTYTVDCSILDPNNPAQRFEARGTFVVGVLG